MTNDGSKLKQVLSLTVVVASLGYFVDMFDLLLFPIVRKPSLTALGITGDAQLAVGMQLMNVQMIGMLVGGIFWGVLGDRKGRLSTLFGSIAVYSVANIANAFVDSVPAYAIWRFIAGLGLAGELGAAVTLVSEVLPKSLRGYGTAVVASVGIFGTVAAGLVGSLMSWRWAYATGGILGLGLLVTRVRLRESAIFQQQSAAGVSRGNFLGLFTNGARFVRFLRCIVIGLPTWYVVGILVAYCDKFGPLLGVRGAVDPAVAVPICYTGISIGSLASGFLSQLLHTRKKVVALFIGGSALGVVLYLAGRGFSVPLYYALIGFLGLTAGYWAVFVTIAAEQFGTNLRSTVATTVPNFVRGSLALITNGYLFFQARVGAIGSAALIGGICISLALFALIGMPETHDRDLNFYE
jgi:hypothetical protein